nr:uncharacterized protein LOC111988130 [Quercus suber]POE82076.1 hypothetical protein CFP56_41844 [Quercus suber]
MASSESVDDSFRARVEKVFGSLASSKSSPWSLTDGEVERREWRRDSNDTRDRDDTPCSSAFDQCFKKDQRASRRKLRRELDDQNDDEDEQSDRSFGGGDADIDEWEIRSSIGLDPTLDREEEEDEFDKVATGRENVGDRLFMGDVSDHGSYLNSHNVLTNSLHGTSTAKDPRANHLAAKIRLKEDEDEAEGEKYNSGGAHDSEVKGQHVETSEDCKQLRSILKRKDNNAVFKPQKRVRFDPSVGSVFEEEEKTMAASLMEPTGSDDGTLEGQNASGLPDYLLNPSKYTRYSFDSTSEFDEESNAQAYMDFINLVNKSKPPESKLEPADTSVDLSKPVIFIPKKKTSDAKAVSDSGVLNHNMEEDRKQFLHRAGFLVGIAAGEAQHEVSAMEEDESQTNAPDGSAGFQKSGRRYRTKSRSDDDDS